MDLATRDVDMAFADLICHDPQWLAAEFDELVSANFSEPPVPRPPAPPHVPPRHVPQYSAPAPRPGPGPAGNAFPVMGPGQRRQRAPPAPLGRPA
jgi:hypothetical protein